MVLVLGMTPLRLLSRDSKTMIQELGPWLQPNRHNLALHLPIMALRLLPIKVIAQGIIAVGVLVGSW